MLYDVVRVKDIGPSYRVINVTKSDMVYVEPGNMFIKISAICAEKIKEELSKGTEILIPKGLEREVLPGDLILNETDELTVIKGSALSRIRAKVDYHLANLSALEFYRFFIINNKLIENGYYITNENRERMYLKIIDTDNKTLISYLEEYLKIMDRISAVEWVYRQYETAEVEINKSKTKKEVDRAEVIFFEMVENPY
jgi:hypothetical protein